MTKLIMVLFLGFSVHSYAGTWKRIDSQTIQFLGSINDDEYEKFEKVFDERVKTLIVTSGGGSTRAALAIAEKLEKQNYTIVVRTWCLSSCANYFFTAAKSKIIEKGIVGFHGAPLGCQKNPSWKEDAEMSIREQAIKLGLSAEQTQSSLDNYIKETISFMEREVSFFSRLGVAQDLFERTCTADKGMNNGKAYSFLLPKPETFQRYGIHSIFGEQDEDTILWFSGDLIVD